MHPSFMKTVGNWFPKRVRGTMVSVFQTCVGVGNIAGLQLSKIVLDRTDNNWPVLFVVLAGLDFVIGVLLFLFLYEHPSHLGLDVELSEKL